VERKAKITTRQEAVENLKRKGNRGRSFADKGRKNRTTEGGKKAPKHYRPKQGRRGTEKGGLMGNEPERSTREKEKGLRKNAREIGERIDPGKTFLGIA